MAVVVAAARVHFLFSQLRLLLLPPYSSCTSTAAAFVCTSTVAYFVVV